MSRFFRRFINKYFGGTRNLIIWVLCVVVTIYFIDSYVLTKERLESLVIGQKGINPAVAGTRSNHPLNDKSKESPVNPQPPVEVKQIQDKPPEKPAEKVPEKPPEVKKDNTKTTAKCGLKEACPSGQYAYSVRSGEGKDIPPTICFDGSYPMTPEKNNGHRGINIVTINGKTMKVEDTRYFDTYVEDGALLRYLKLGVLDNFIVIGASFDEASANLGSDGKAWLRNYGVTVTDKIKFRDAFSFIGQRGLKEGSAIQKLGERSDQEFADPVEVRGCLKPVLGELTKIDVNKMPVGDQSNVKVGEEQPQCGVKDGCGPESFPVHIYSGKGNSEGPKLCVSGKYVLAKGLNDGGRGINIAIVDPKTKDVTKVGHFDTYSEDSSNLEIFLEMMNDKEIIIAVAHDDASKKLSDHAKSLFNTLGSGMIQNMKFRDVWAFVGQKGIKGFAEIEQIEFAGPASSFPRPIDKKTCVPLTLQGSKIKPDPLAGKNEKRRKFCSKYDGYGDFCEVEHMDEALTPAPLSDKVLEHHKIFQVPIIVIPGLNHNAVRMQLETLLMQPGIKTEMVTVMYDEKFDESAALAELFNYKTAKLSSSTKYIFQVEKALEKVWELYPSAKHVIVLEEEVILAPDFLNFFAQCLNAVEKDDTLMGVSAWNDNGYEGVSIDPGLAYRADTFPGLGFLLKRSFYDAHMKGNMKTCCGNRSWDGWLNGKLQGREMIIPDVSRVYRRPYEGLSEQAEFLTELFNRARHTNLELKSVIRNTLSLTSSEYDADVTSLLRSSTALDTTYASDCLQERGLGFYVPETSGKSYSVYYEQSNSEDHEILRKLCKCFKLFAAPKHQARSLHKGMLRFTYKGNNMFFVGSASPFYQQKPGGYKEIKRKLS